MTGHADLIRRLLEVVVFMSKADADDDAALCQEAADALKAAQARIAELESTIPAAYVAGGWDVNGLWDDAIAKERAKHAETKADLAAARAALEYADHERVFAWTGEHATAIAAARSTITESRSHD